ncbi:hypothetical protein PMAYCL1PPCAC_05854 [Pristionchus mayeri]|uniref:Uncharacterized protein n=1 Tax=Pristionchus mayeri TaxID=1317129 RepID=A0AAN5CB53_9BILA|nr:hypothetical protein PMAYCL1PPCAC_05854 [Pristionchus mayeri]
MPEWSVVALADEFPNDRQSIRSEVVLSRRPIHPSHRDPRHTERLKFLDLLGVPSQLLLHVILLHLLQHLLHVRHLRRLEHLKKILLALHRQILDPEAGEELARDRLRLLRLEPLRGDDQATGVDRAVAHHVLGEVLGHVHRDAEVARDHLDLLGHVRRLRGIKALHGWLVADIPEQSAEADGLEDDVDRPHDTVAEEGLESDEGVGRDDVVVQLDGVAASHGWIDRLSARDEAEMSGN